MDSTIIVTIITGIFGLITVLLNRSTNKKVDKIQEVKDYCKEMMDNHILENDKTYLTDFLSDIEAKEPKSQIQIRRAYEIKKEYNQLGGDRRDELVKRGILKEKKAS